MPRSKAQAAEAEITVTPFVDPTEQPESVELFGYSIPIRPYLTVGELKRFKKLELSSLMNPDALLDDPSELFELIALLIRARLKVAVPEGTFPSIEEFEDWPYPQLQSVVDGFTKIMMFALKAMGMLKDDEPVKDGDTVEGKSRSGPGKQPTPIGI